MYERKDRNQNCNYNKVSLFNRCSWPIKLDLNLTGSSHCVSDLQPGPTISLTESEPNANGTRESKL